MNKTRNFIASIITVVAVFFAVLTFIPSFSLIMLADFIRGSGPGVSSEEMTRRIKNITEKLNSIDK